MTSNPQIDKTLHVERLGRIDYAAALEAQEHRLRRRLAGEIGDTLLLLEHEPVYTLGRGAKEADLLDAPQRLGVPVFRVSRGGGATYHGHGQLVAYPILALARHGRDVHRYVRSLEEVLIRVCAAFGVEASRREKLTGVWVGDRKIASIGVGVRRWVSFHGIALNVGTDLRYFRAIVPCAMPQLAVTTLEIETRRSLGLAAAAAAFEAELRAVFGFDTERQEAVA